MKLLAVMALCILTCAPLSAEHSPEAYTIQLPPSPDFQRLNWLVGAWSGKTIGAKPAGVVALSVSYGLDKRFMVLHESISLPATKAAPASKEDLLGVLGIGRATGEFALDLYSSSGFVTHYQATVEATEVQFNPAGGRLAPQGWLFRRTLKLTGSTRCTESVSVAPPGGAFFEYYTADLHRTPSAGEMRSAFSPPKSSSSEKQQPVKTEPPPAQ